MGLVTLPTTFADGVVPTAAQFNGDFQALANELNGNIENANIKASAGITESKIAFDASSGHSHNGVDSKQIKSLAQFERARYGVLITGTSMCPRWYNKTGLTLTLSGIYLYAVTAPTGADLIVDVNKNGTTIFSTTTNRPTIAAGANSGTSGTPDTVSIADGEYLDWDIDQVGSTIPGSDLLIVAYF